jgi:cardiolipin synthase
VDGVWTSVGSTNFDNRSFRLNDEVNMNAVDEAFAARETETFKADLLRSREITFAEWARRPWTERLKERRRKLDQIAALTDSCRLGMAKNFVS